jgi:hypothetical protein
VTTADLTAADLSPTAIALVDVLRTQRGTVVVDPPGAGSGYWAGGPNAVFHDGAYWMAYRLRRPVTEGRGYANVVARSTDGEHFETVATVTAEQFDCASLERPALVPLPTGGWRLYVSCSTLNSKHWWVESIEAADMAELAGGRRTVVLPGDSDTAWKDVVVSYIEPHGWQMWACRHPLDGGDDEADRMTTWYFESADGLDWTPVSESLKPDADGWDRRGRRVGAVAELDGVWVMLYDGRRDAAENWEERTGIAVGARPSEFAAVAIDPIGGVEAPGGCLRYSSFLADPSGGLRVYYETTRSDGAHDLRTVFVPPVG